MSHSINKYIKESGENEKNFLLKKKSLKGIGSSRRTQKFYFTLSFILESEQKNSIRTISKEF